MDALGFNFWTGQQAPRHARRGRRDRRVPSPRACCGSVSSSARRPPRSAQPSSAVGLGAVQLHGDEDPADYAGAGVALWQVLRIDSTLPEAASPHASEVLLDAKVDGFGGAGRAFDWSLARDAGRYRVPFWLAGGLTPANVGEAVRRAQPPGVDVASGVESRPRMKDPALVRAFVAAVRAAEER